MSKEILIKITGCFDHSTQHYKFARLVFGEKHFNMQMKLPWFTIPIPFMRNDHGLYHIPVYGWILK